MRVSSNFQRENLALSRNIDEFQRRSYGTSVLYVRANATSNNFDASPTSPEIYDVIYISLWRRSYICERRELNTWRETSSGNKIIYLVSIDPNSKKW